MNKILVTGSNGFVGKNLVQYLETKGYNIVPTTSKDCNLLDYEATKDLINHVAPDCIVHLAATCGGIGINARLPFEFMNENLVMGMNLINATPTSIRKFIMVGSVCAYPKFTPVPFKEDDLWNGYPEETNAPYGIAKKTLIELLLAANKELNFNCVNLMPSNMFGKYDDFDPDNSHVVPAIIQKVHNAIKYNKESISIWGTGEASREFLHVNDFARAVELSIEREPGPKPINIGTGREIKIKQLVSMICNIMGYKGRVVYDYSKPDGQPRRCLDITRAYMKLGYRPTVALESGLKDTIEWWLNNG